MRDDIPQILSAEFPDPYAMAAAQREAGIEYLAVSGGAYRAGLTMMDFGNFSVQVAHDGAHVVHGTMRPDRIGVLFPIGPSEARINGVLVPEPAAIVLAPGAEIIGQVAAPLEWGAIAFDRTGFEDQLASSALPGGASWALHAALNASSPDLRRVCVELTALGRRDPHIFRDPAVRASVQETVRAALRHCFDQSGVPETPSRAMRQSVRLVAQADAYLHADVGRPILTEELCAALSTSPRALHGAFVTIHGMSVQRFLRLRRLNLVREALRAAQNSEDLVKTVALRHGFWHLGRFAQAYRSVFGENPSQTKGRHPRPALAVDASRQVLAAE